MHLELVSFSATAPGASGAAAAALTGDSLIIKNNRGISGPRIIDLWGMQQASGFGQLAFPSGHDTTRGYRYGVELGDTSTHLNEGTDIDITAQETMSITLAGSATAGDVELGFMHVLYPDLPGVDQRLISWAGLKSQMQKQTTVFATIIAGVGVYGTGELINAESDLLLANRDYALMGITTTVDCGVVWIQGPDTGYTRIGVPGADQFGWFGSQYFCRLARAHDAALIPVFSSGNKNAITIGAVADENGASVVATLHLALLKR